jgi:UDP-N-acetylglucosamine diphosphorylase / glucose-1-phosphate thymidylyltransferase / UDP-N-acetylgalactosamine diphosphorylase / glucosamine-1-phosphate N-acetyltransferase / galactosamine-1-phosphate N-acetyltransferase
MFSPSDYFDLSQTEHRTLLDNNAQVWEALKQIASYLQFRLKPAMLGRLIGRPHLSSAIYLGHGTVVENGATLLGPAWIGNNCQIRSGCYIRENVIVGDGVVLGNCCEFKNCLVFNGAQIPHFNYVGDSIVGYKAHLGAGVVLSNVRLDRKEVVIRFGDQAVPTGLRKFGAIIGDRAEIGCHAVLNPGSIVGKNSVVYPQANFGGVLPEDTVLKTIPALVQAPRHPK